MTAAGRKGKALVKIRLRRTGATKRPTYRIVAADSHAARDGRFIETLGHYNPLTHPATVVVNEERVQHWLSHGAQPTEVVVRLLSNKGIIEAPVRPVVKPKEEAAPAAPATRSRSRAAAAAPAATEAAAPAVVAEAAAPVAEEPVAVVEAAASAAAEPATAAASEQPATAAASEQPATAAAPEEPATAAAPEQPEAAAEATEKPAKETKNK